MKKLILLLMIVCFGISVQAQKQADIVFEKDTINLGTFSEKDGIQKCAFIYRNTGTAPLILHQVMSSCGCTVPDYPKAPLQPGDTAAIDVTYNGKGKLTGKFTKAISVRSNAKTGIKRLFITGVMTD